MRVVRERELDGRGEMGEERKRCSLHGMEGVYVWVGKSKEHSTVSDLKAQAPGQAAILEALTQIGLVTSSTVKCKRS